MAGLTGLEPAASCVTGRRSNRAELQPLFIKKNYNANLKNYKWAEEDLNL